MGAALCAAALLVQVQTIQAQYGFPVGQCTVRTSPNKLLEPQCTWFVDIKANESGRRLVFSRTWGRDARLWPELLVGIQCANGPQVNCIAVFDSLNTPPSETSPAGAGHVAWIESITATGFTVLHSSFAGTMVGTVNGVPINRTTFAWVAPGYVKSVNGTTVYRIRTFIRP